jgi:hypothetical protein
VKWVVLAVVVILVAPTIAKRLEALDPEKRDDPADPASPRRRGIVYRAVRRFGPRTVLVGYVLIVAILAVALYLLIRRV